MKKTNSADLAVSVDKMFYKFTKGTKLTGKPSKTIALHLEFPLESKITLTKGNQRVIEIN